MFRVSLVVALALVGAGCLAEEPLLVAAPVAASTVVTSPAPEAPGSSVIFLAPRLDAAAPLPSTPPIGVAECDRYIALVDACAADASARQGGTRRLLEKDAPSWRELARSSTEGRLAVTFACQAALDGLRQKPCR
jgi:hypothetical protein